MKLTFLLPIAFALLAACERPPEETLIKIPGYVNVEILDLENKKPTLPPQISINLENARAGVESLKINSLDSLLLDMLYSDQPDVLYFGCNEFQANELPLKIDAEKVVLCGNIKIPTNGFEMRASYLELRNAQLSAAAPERPDEFDPANPQMLVIYTANLSLTGSSKLVLQGFQKGRERQTAPALFLNLAKVEGAGTLEIFSRSSVKTVKY